MDEEGTCRVGGTLAYIPANCERLNVTSESLRSERSYVNAGSDFSRRFGS